MREAIALPTSEPRWHCPDCGVATGVKHKDGCDIARCPRCGLQRLSCNCIYEVNGMNPATLAEDHPAIYADGPTEAMYAVWDRLWSEREPVWTGEWPGVAECREYGWYAKLTPPHGWVKCDASTVGATEDLNRLYTGEAHWDQTRQRWVQNERKK